MPGVEGGGWTVRTAAPGHEAAMKVVAAGIDPAVQTTRTDFLGDGSSNPPVEPADPVLKGVRATIASAKPKLPTRYWGASPRPPGSSVLSGPLSLEQVAGTGGVAMFDIGRLAAGYSTNLLHNESVAQCLR